MPVGGVEREAIMTAFIGREDLTSFAQGRSTISHAFWEIYKVQMGWEVITMGEG
jgi:hypothetical protein